MIAQAVYYFFIKTCAHGKEHNDGILVIIFNNEMSIIFTICKVLRIFGLPHTTRPSNQLKSTCGDCHIPCQTFHLSPRQRKLQI